MLKIEKTDTAGWQAAFRGMRNPLNSWDKSDSYYTVDGEFVIGKKDIELAKKLAKAGSDHRKYLRQIFVSVDITAPLPLVQKACILKGRGDFFYVVVVAGSVENFDQPCNIGVNLTRHVLTPYIGFSGALGSMTFQCWFFAD